jgi:hypothetical protein
MSALGQKQTFRYGSVMSALPPKADIAGRDLDVRFVPRGDIVRLPTEAASLVIVLQKEFIGNLDLIRPETRAACPSPRHMWP